MAKAPYVSPRMVTGKIVFDVRYTKAVLNAFSTLKKRETYDLKAEADARGYEIKRKFEEWKVKGDIVGFVDDRSVEALFAYYKGSNEYLNLKAASTKRSYLGHMIYLLDKRVVLPGTKTPFGKMLVGNIDYRYASSLWRFIEDHMCEKWDGAHKPGHKANHCFKLLKRIWAVGLKADFTSANVFREVELPTLPDRQIMWEPDQYDGMIKFCDEQGFPAMGTMLTMCYEFCQRPGDIRMMKWANIDGRTGVSNFVQQKTRQRMAIKVTNKVTERLHLHQKRNSDDFIFHYDKDGRPYTQDWCNKHFRELAKKFGLPTVPEDGQFNLDGSQKYTSLQMMDLRRTGATHASRSGCTDREMVALTGHKNPNMLVVYAVTGEIESTNANNKRGLHNG